MKTGRNDPCPCNSGKKFKKCCINKDNFPEVTIDLELGRKLIKEFEKQQESSQEILIEP